MTRSNFLDYTFYDRTHPAGSNTLSAESNYFQRSLYREVLYPATVPAPLDTWYGRIYYGKIDPIQNSVIPDIAILKPITISAGTNLYALECVVDAFEGFAAHMRDAQILGFLSPSGNDALVNVKARRAYEDPTRAYEDYTATFFNAFNSKTPIAQRRRIKDFTSFLEVYVPYLKHVAAQTPVTKTAFILSRHVNVYHSGLSVAIDKGDVATDADKYNKFLRDPNFSFYAGCAKKFGFLINKNMPWTLTFDLFSNASLKYIENYYNVRLGPVTKRNFFQANYVPTYLTDPENLKNILINSYIEFVRQNPSVDTVVYNPHCAGFPDKYTVETSYRLTPHAPALREQLTDNYIINLYLMLRYNETKKPFRLSAQFYSNLRAVYAGVDNSNLSALQSVASYINGVFREYIYGTNYLTYGNTKSINYLLGLDIAPEFGTLESTGISEGATVTDAQAAATSDY